MNNSLQVIILAAGFGSRLRPLTDNSPKCLLNVGGQTILERALNILLKRKEIEKITIVTGYLHSSIENFIKKNYPKENIWLVENKKYETTNNAYSLYLALKENPQSFVLLDGDLVFDSKLFNQFLDSPNPNALVVENNKNLVNEESMKAQVNEKGFVNLLSKKLKMDESLGEYIGLAKFDQTWAASFVNQISKLPESKWANSYYEDIANQLITIQSPIDTIPTNNLFWSEIDTLDDLEKTTHQLKQLF